MASASTISRTKVLSEHCRNTERHPAPFANKNMSKFSRHWKNKFNQIRLVTCRCTNYKHGFVSSIPKMLQTNHLVCVTTLSVEYHIDRLWWYWRNFYLELRSDIFRSRTLWNRSVNPRGPHMQRVGSVWTIYSNPLSAQSQINNDPLR